jgi:hypothetical protein
MLSLSDFGGESEGFIKIRPVNKTRKLKETIAQGYICAFKRCPMRATTINARRRNLLALS